MIDCILYNELIKFVDLFHPRPADQSISIKISFGLLIDIGCGTKPYRDLLAPYVAEHIGVDHQQTLHNKSNIDRFGTAYDLPAEKKEDISYRMYD